MCPALPASSEPRGSTNGQPLHGQGLVDFQTQLLFAMTKQVEAINRLASSNEALVRAMASDGDDDGEAPPSAYMNGLPVR